MRRRVTDLDFQREWIHRDRATVTTPVTDRSLIGQQVAVVGRLSLLSKRDARALVEQLGGTFSADMTPRTTVVVTDESGGDVPPYVTRVLTEAELCLAAGLPDLDTLRSQYYSGRDLRGMYPVLRDEHLRYLEKWGLVGPVAGRYSFTDLHVIKQAAGSLEAGLTLSQLLRTLASERDGQLSLEFQAGVGDRAPARVVSLPASAQPEASLFPPGRAQQVAAANHALAAKYFIEGAELDDGPERNLDGAAAAYRRAVLFDPHLVPALVNLANIHYERDELVEAEAIYEKAIRVDTDCFEAYFNLGNIHHDLGRYAEAVTSYRDALAINPTYPEAHFYLAVTLEKLGRSAEAKPHWRQYRELAPDGEFVDLAREFSE